MTLEKILDLAHTAALEKWIRAKTKLEEMPNNKIRQYREQETWKDVLQIEKIRKDLIEEEILT